MTKFKKDVDAIWGKDCKRIYLAVGVLSDSIFNRQMIKVTEYKHFAFCEYSDERGSKKAFNYLVEFAKQGCKEHSESSCLRVMDKSGVTYCRYKNYVIVISKSCSDNHKEENNMEDQFFNRYYPKTRAYNDTVFMRISCGGGLSDLK